MIDLRPKILELEEQLPVLKQKYRETMKMFLSTPLEKEAEKRSALRDVHELGVDYFNAVERLIAHGALTGADQDPTWFTDKAETAVNVLGTIKNHFLTVRQFAVKFGLPSYDPSPTAYANMQRLVKKHDPQVAVALRASFQADSLPTYGFDKEESTKLSSAEKLFAAFTGIIILVILLVIAIFIPQPSEFQIFIFRVVLALSSGAFAGIMTGFLNIESQYSKLALKAGGGLAVFVVIYWFNPPQLLSKSITQPNNPSMPTPSSQLK